MQNRPTVEPKALGTLRTLPVTFILSSRPRLHADTFLKLRVPLYFLGHVRMMAIHSTQGRSTRENWRELGLQRMLYEFFDESAQLRPPDAEN
jgi:hypothetical protein